MSVPPPRYHTVKYAGVIANASKWRSQIAPALPTRDATAEPFEAIDEAKPPRRPGTYRAWAELLKRTFDFDVLRCQTCNGRMKLLALVTESKGVARYLRAIGEQTDSPGRSPSRGPPYWKSFVLRRKALHDVA